MTGSGRLPGGRGWQRVRVGVAAHSAIRKRRKAAQAQVAQQFHEAMEQEQVVAAAIAAALAAAASAEDHQTVRRVVHRSTGKWRGSTLAGYLRTDDKAGFDNTPARRSYCV